MIKLLWEERRINILTPSNLKITRQGGRLIEVYYDGKLEIDDLDRFSNLQEITKVNGLDGDTVV